MNGESLFQMKSAGIQQVLTPVGRWLKQKYIFAFSINSLTANFLPLRSLTSKLVYINFPVDHFCTVIEILASGLLYSDPTGNY